MSMFKPSGWPGANELPQLKGKAAELKHFARPLLTLFEKHMTRASKIHRFVRLLLSASVEIEHIVAKTWASSVT